MAEIAKGMKRFGLRLPKRTYRVLRTRARWEKRSCASLTREAINKYLVSEIERGRLCKAFKIIDYIFSGDKKHGIMFMDVLPQWLKEDEETCKELSFWERSEAESVLILRLFIRD